MISVPDTICFKILNLPTVRSTYFHRSQFWALYSTPFVLTVHALSMVNKRKCRKGIQMFMFMYFLKLEIEYFKNVSKMLRIVT